MKTAILFFSAAITVIAGINLRDPAFLAGSLGKDRVLWLKADAGVTTNSSGRVLVWADQSGNGYNVTPTVDPSQSALFTNSVMNSKPSLRFNISDSAAMNNTNVVNFGALNELSFFAVVQPISFGVGYHWIFGASQDNGVNGWNVSYYVAKPAWWYLGNGAVTAFNTDTVVGTPVLIEIIYNPASSPQAEFFQNGVSDGTDSHTLLATAGANFSINVQNAGTIYGDQFISEIILYKKALNEGRRKAVESYLNSKYHIY